MPTWLKPGTVSRAADTMASSVSCTVARESSERIAGASGAGVVCCVHSVFTDLAGDPVRGFRS
jgi:hypothetical protein